MTGKKRKGKDYLKLGRSLAENHYKTENKKSANSQTDSGMKKPFKKALFRLNQFFGNRIFTWFYHYIKSRFGRKYPFQTYGKDDNGIYQFSNKLTKIACAADWASDTPESLLIAGKIAKQKPEYTIHLGDTYFVGEPDEIKDNFINKKSSWHRGSKGSFALLGNHEMFSRGIGYFKYLLPSLGLKSSTNDEYTGQKASFFCLESDHWRVVGLDTGYSSIGAIPILENISLLGKIPLLGKLLIPKCSLHEKLMEWLKNSVKLKGDKKGLIFLSHHQYCSAFEKDFGVIGKQLGKLVGSKRPVIWIWGHEHRMSVYSKYGIAPCLTAYGRCIGHGGMPVELVKDIPSEKIIKKKPLVLFDNRLRETIDGIKVGFNGYLMLNIEINNLEIEYYDQVKKVLTEKWTVDNKTGILKGISIQNDEKNLTLTQELNNAIK